MTTRSEIKNKFDSDTSVHMHGYICAHLGADMFYEVAYYDLRGKFHHIQLPMGSTIEQDTYKDFLSYKGLKHWQDYQEYITYKKEETFGTDINPPEWFVEEWVIEGKRVATVGEYPSWTRKRMSVRITERCAGIPWETKITEGDGLRETFPPVEDFKTKEIWLKYVKKWLNT